MPRQKGFTFLELLIVVAIVGIIAAVAMPSLLAARRTASQTERFRRVNEPLTRHLEITLNDKVIDTSKPQANWIGENEKTIARPFVAQRLKLVCEDASVELARLLKFKQELLTTPVDDQHVGMNRRLELLVEANKGIAYFTAVTGDGNKSCSEARQVAKTLDLLSK